MTIERPDDPVIACTLTPSQAEGQLSAWAELIDGAVSVTRADGHLRVVLPMTAGARAEELAARERACCAFLDISVIAASAPIPPEWLPMSSARPRSGMFSMPKVLTFR